MNMVKLMKLLTHTLGCKVNQYETEAIKKIFLDSGYTISYKGEDPDVIFINSCTVTAESDRKTRQLLRRFRKAHRNAVIILGGCMPQATPSVADGLYEADIIIGNTDISRCVELVEKFMKERRRIVDINEHKKDEVFNTPPVSDFGVHTRAFLKIEDGCERYCSYCIIPKARGRVRSKPIEEIKKEANALAEAGYREIVIVGINLSAYGKDVGVNLCDAVDAVCGVDGIQRVRLGSLEPDHISDEMLYRLKKQPKFCPQFHLSLQSGCDATLKRMNRCYDSSFYYDLVCRIRGIFNNPAITTDIMVGFAGEDDEEFEESVEFAKKVGFAKSHVFSYSRRPGTFADTLPGQVTKSVKECRSRRMIAVTERSEKKFLESQCGNNADVLFETGSNGVYEGYTKNYTKVKMEYHENICGQIMNVKLICADNGSLKAEYTECEGV